MQKNYKLMFRFFLMNNWYGCIQISDLLKLNEFSFILRPQYSRHDQQTCHQIIYMCMAMQN